MAEPRAFSYKFKEIAEILVKEQDLHEGFWGISFEFAIGAGMIPYPQGDNANLIPAAIVPVIKVGIHKFDEPNSLTVDAAEVNPLPSKKSSRKKKAAAKETSPKESPR